MAFRTEADFHAEAYLGAKAHVEQQDDGGLVIEGYAATWGEDDQDERFEPGAFDEGIKSFLERNPLLAYHHDGGKALGRVEHLENRSDGLWMRAHIDPPIDQKGWAAEVIDKIKRGTIRGLSVRGKFHRRVGPDGRIRIWKSGLREISVTPLPVSPESLFAIAGKAFPDIDEDEVAQLEAALDGVKAILDDCGCDGQKAAPSAEQRKKHGMSDGAFPVWHCGSGPGSVKSALHLAAHSKTHSEESVKAHIRKRAKALGCESQVEG